MNPNMDNINEVLIKPSFAGVLDWAEASYTTQCGKVSTKWERTEDGYTVNVSIPEGVTGNVCLNGTLTALPVGTSQWHMKA